MRWTISMDRGPCMLNHAGVVLDGDIYYFADSMDSIIIHVLRTKSLEWESVQHKDNEEGLTRRQPSMPFQRYCHTVFAYNDKIYKWGGRNFHCNVLYCFDPKRTLSWTIPTVTGSIPLARDGHSVCMVGNSMYIYGGYITSGTRERADDVYCLNFETMEWAEVPTTGERPAIRDFHSAVLINDRMYVFGGRCHHPIRFRIPEKRFCAKIYYLDLKTKVWHCPENTGGDIPLGRHSHAMFTYNGMIYVFGGINGDLKRHLNDLHVYDPQTNCWQLLAPAGKPPCARRLPVCTVIDTQMFLFGGVSGENAYNDLHVLDFLPSLQTLSMASAVESGRNMEKLPENMKKGIRTIMQPL